MKIVGRLREQAELNRYFSSGKRTAFLAETGARKAVHITMVTTYGLTGKGHPASVQSEVTLNDLFSRDI